MRKKSHVLLGWYLAQQLDNREIRFHKKSFCYGNLIPDLKPSFVTVRHEYKVNFKMVCKKIRRLSEEFRFIEPYTAAYWRQIGEIVHYVADYFTFPHNEHFRGSLVEHTCYEGELKNSLKECILSGKADEYIPVKIIFDSADEVIDFIRNTHDQYMEKERCVEDDVRYIVSVCYQAAQGMLQVMAMTRNMKYTSWFIPEFV